MIPANLLEMTLSEVMLLVESFMEDYPNDYDMCYKLVKDEGDDLNEDELKTAMEQWSAILYGNFPNYPDIVKAVCICNPGFN